MRDDRVRLLDIQEALSGSRKMLGRDKKRSRQEELIQTWIVHHLQIIGEAARTLSSDLKDQHPEMPWSKIIGMRDPGPRLFRQ